MTNRIVFWFKRQFIDARNEIEIRYKDLESRQHKSLFIFEFDHPLRQICLKIVYNSLFTYFILLCVLINSITLTLSINAYKNNNNTIIYNIIEIIFNIIFTIEFIIYIIGLGFLPLNNNSYLSSKWNILDVIVLIGSWIDFIITRNSNNKGINFNLLRCLRLLKPLKFIGNIPALKVQVIAIINALPALLNILFVFMFFLLIFAIMSTQFFGGILRFRCVNDDGTLAEFTPSQVYGICDSKSVIYSSSGATCISNTFCRDVGGEPRVSKVISFDNLYNSCIALLFVILYWEFDVYNRIQEAVGHGYDFWFLFLKLFMFYIILSLGTTTMLLKFKDAKTKSKENKDYLEMDAITDEKSDNDEPKISVPVIENPLIKKLDVIILICVLINILIMSFEHYNMPNDLKIFINISNFIFVIIFTLEMIIKLYLLGFKQYISNSWNIFDVFVVIVSWIDVIFVGTGFGLSALKIFRIFRVFRVLKLVKFFPDVQHTIQAILQISDDLKYSFVLLLLFMFIYALIGYQIFNTELINSKKIHDIDRYNFTSFYWSCLTVFKITIGAWGNSLTYLANASPIIGVIYHFALICMGNVLLLSLFLGILFHNFSLIKTKSWNNITCLCSFKNDIRSYHSIPNNPLRLYCQIITQHYMFEYFIYIINIYSCIILMVNDKESFNFVKISNILVTVFFCLEITIKCIALTFKVFISNFFNIWAIFVTIISMLSVIVVNDYHDQTALQYIRIIIALQAFRVCMNIFIHLKISRKNIC